MIKRSTSGHKPANCFQCIFYLGAHPVILCGGTLNPALSCFIVVMMSGPVGNSLTSVVSSTSDKESKWIIHFVFFIAWIAIDAVIFLGYPIPFLSRINQLDDQHLICSVMTLWVTMGKRDNLILFLPVHTGTLHPQTRTLCGLDVNIHLLLPSYLPFFFLSSISPIQIVK